MPFTVEDFRDLVRLVEERPEWRADLRRLLLTDDLLALPEQMTSLRAQTERGFQELTAAQRRTEERMARLEEIVAQLVEAQRQATTQMTRLAEAQRQTEEQMAEFTGQMAESKRIAQTLSTDVGGLKGLLLELRYRDRAPGRPGGARKTP